MRFFILVFLLSVISVSVAQAKSFAPSDSGKEIEVQIASLLKEKLKVEANLKVTDEKGDDLRVATLFGEDKKKNIPKVAAFVDTKVINKDKSGKAVSQVISIFSTAEIKINTKDRLRLLEWANTWNNNILPIRIQVAKNNIIAATNLVTTKANPVNDQTVLSSYLSVIQVWPAIIQSLEKSKLLVK